MRTLPRVLAIGAAMAFLVIPVAPAEAAAQIECYYCFDGGGGWECCVETVQTVACGASSGCGHNGCDDCGGEEEDFQDTEVALSLGSDGTLRAEGTPLDGVDPAWLAFTTQRRHGLLTFKERCREVRLHLSVELMALLP